MGLALKGRQQLSTSPLPSLLQRIRLNGLELKAHVEPRQDVVDGQHVGANRPIVCKLRRSLYGLRQAGRVWVILFASFLISWGLVRSSIDCCLYTYTSPSDEILWIAVYVDDALICDNSPELRARFVADLSERFPTEDKGELSWILNVAITRDRSSRTISMSQAL